MFSTLQKPKASLSHKTNGLHSLTPTNPKSSSDLSPAAQEPDLDPLVQNLSPKKKKKKKKRRRSEMEDDVETLTSSAPATPIGPSEPPHDKKSRKKKKKKRKHEENGETMKESVLSHLGASSQEEDWCQNGLWSLTSHTDAEPSKQKMRLSATSPTQRESKQIQQETEQVRKKKKKKKRRIEQEEGVQEINSTCSRSERWVLICSLLSSYLRIFVSNSAWSSSKTLLKAFRHPAKFSLRQLMKLIPCDFCFITQLLKKCSTSEAPLYKCLICSALQT